MTKAIGLSAVRTELTSWQDADRRNLKKEQFNLRFQKASGQLEATGRDSGRSSRHCAHQDESWASVDALPRPRRQA